MLARLPNEEEFTTEYICQYCGSDRHRRILGPHPGGHYAKIVCLECDRFHKWEGKPEGTPKRRKNQAKLLERYSKGFCELCLRQSNQIPLPQVLEAHHVIPVTDGGSDDRDNIQIVCTACHKLIHHQRTYLGHYLNSYYPSVDEGRESLNTEILQVIIDRGISKRQAIAILQSSFPGKQRRDDLETFQLEQLLDKLRSCKVEGGAA